MTEIKRKELKLSGATEVSRLHPDQLQPPEMAKLRNLAISRSDLLPGLRPDLVLSGARPATVAEDWDPSLDDEPDFLNRLLWSYNTRAEIYVSRMWPFIVSGGAVASLAATYAAGTVSNHADSDRDIVGTSTAWLRNVWPGCWILFSGDDTYYLIESVTDDELLTLASVPGKLGAAASYTIYKTWHPELGLWPVKAERFGFNAIIKPVRPTAPVAAETICGPFYSAIEAEGLRSDDWVQQVVSATYRPTGGGVLANDYNVLACSGGRILYAADSDYYADPVSGVDLLTWTEVDTGAGVTFYGIDGGDDAAGTGTFFVAVGANGEIYTAGSTPDSWTERTSGVTVSTITGVVVNAGFDGVALASIYGTGSSGAIRYSDDDGATWAASLVGQYALWDIAVATDGTDDTVIAVGYEGTILRASSDGMSSGADWATATWTEISGVPSDVTLYRVYGAGRADAAEAGNWLTVGMVTGGLMRAWRSTDDGLTWTEVALPSPGSGLRSSPLSQGITYWAADGLWYVTEGLSSTSGAGWVSSRALVSATGSSWEAQDLGYAGGPGRPFTGLVNGSAVLLAPYYAAPRIAYASAPLSLDFAAFAPVSADKYRAHAFCVAGGYCVYGCMREWDAGDSEWDLYPMRVRWAAPGEVVDFDGTGAGFMDLKGTGQILDLCAVGTSIIAGETDRISCLSPGIVSTWEHRPLAAGLWQLSNMVELNEVAYFVASDGLLYGATPAGVMRVDSGFDLSLGADWQVVSHDAISISYSGSLQCLLIFAAAEPYRLHLVEPESGQHAVWELPQYIYHATTDLTPRMVSSLRTPDADRLLVSYGETDVRAVLTSLEAAFDGPVEGLDDIGSEDPYDEGKWHATYQTGVLRLGEAGATAEIKDVEVHLYCWPDEAIDELTDDDEPTLTGPDVAVEIRSNEDSDWRSLAESGTIAITESACLGTGTAFANKIGAGNDSTVVFHTPCRAAKARVYTESGGTYTATTAYTVTGTHQITFTAAPATGIGVYAFWSGEPLVSAAVGDYVCTDLEVNGDTSDYAVGWHRITAVTDATNLVLDWYPAGPWSTGDGPSVTNYGRLVKAQQVPVGRSVLTFGIGAKVEELVLRITVIPREGSTAAAVCRPIRAVVSYVETGDEAKNDE